jgi:hypothetical protein
MKTLKQPFTARFALHILAACALLAFAGAARAAAILSFSGGNGTPLALTLNLPVSYTINAAPTGSEPFFLFKSVGNVLGSQQGLSGSISYSVNGGSAHAITAENSGVATGIIAANDLYFFGTSSTLANGDVVTLTGGTVTTTGNVASAPPAGGSFATLLTDSNGAQVSTAGITVPEPTTWGLLCLGATALLRCRRRPG